MESTLTNSLWISFKAHSFCVFKLKVMTHVLQCALRVYKVPVYDKLPCLASQKNKMTCTHVWRHSLVALIWNGWDSCNALHQFNFCLSDTNQQSYWLLPSQMISPKMIFHFKAFFIKSVDLKTKDPGNPDSTFSFWIFFLQRVHLGTFKFALCVDWLSK